MPRKKKKPDYNPELSMEELLTEVASAYGFYDDRKETDKHEPSLNALAVEYDLNVLKVRKLLITAGVYSTVASRKIGTFVNRGFSIKEIMTETGLSRASVNSYLPYVDVAYKLPETSVEADRAKVYRQRRSAVKKLQKCIALNWNEQNGNTDTDKELLWKCVLRFEGYRFKTAKGLPFTYMLKPNRAGDKSGELIISRKSKGVTRASVELAYDRVVEVRNNQKQMIPVMTTPKRLNVFGASYLYPMFIRFGLIVSEFGLRPVAATRWERIRDEFVDKVENVVVTASNPDEIETLEGGVLSKEAIDQVKDIAIETAATKWGSF